MAKAGLNGNFHQDAVHNTVKALTDLGVSYLGDGEWKLPAGAKINAVGEEDWILTMADGTEYHVWSED